MSEETAADRPPPPLVCTACSQEYAVESLVWRCTCGGVLDVADFGATLDPRRLAGRAATLWRYQEALPLPYDGTVSMGEGMSPLVASTLLDHVDLKLDFLMPTLSFKDRGAAVMATLAKHLGVRSAIVDSSGNAGTATAAYFGRAGIACQVFVPASTSPAKLAQMRAHGATVQLVPGSRADTSAATLQVAGRPGVLYASHIYHPYFLHGVKTYGYEIWEQSGGALPDTVVVPVGNGTLVLGCFLAFTELVEAGLVDRLPVLIAVQAAGCSPLEKAFEQDLTEPAVIADEPTVAEGIAITAPPRGRQILAAVRATGGTIVSVADPQVLAARAELAAAGLFVEPTSAVCWAAARAAADGSYDAASPTWRDAAPHFNAGRVVLPLCGAGLKSPGTRS